MYILMSQFPAELNLRMRINCPKYSGSSSILRLGSLELDYPTPLKVVISLLEVLPHYYNVTIKLRSQKLFSICT